MRNKCFKYPSFHSRVYGVWKCMFSVGVHDGDTRAGLLMMGLLYYTAADAIFRAT